MPTKYLTPDEVEKFFRAVKKSSRNPERDNMVLLLVFRHGLRLREIGLIKLRDINPETGELYVNRLKGCNSAPHRLPLEEIQAYKSYLPKRAQINVSARVDALFISERRKSLNQSTVLRTIQETAKAAGLDYLRINSMLLRRTYARYLASKGTDLRDIHAHLRHRSISLTLAYIT